MCATALTGLTPAQVAAPGVVAASCAGVVALLAAAGVCRFAPATTLDRAGICVALALGGVLLASTLDLLSSDSSITGQSVLAFPVLWVASHLRRGAVVLAGVACWCGPTACRDGWSGPCRSRRPSTR